MVTMAPCLQPGSSQRLWASCQKLLVLLFSPVQKQECWRSLGAFAFCHWGLAPDHERCLVTCLCFELPAEIGLSVWPKVLQDKGGMAVYAHVLCCYYCQ